MHPKLKLALLLAASLNVGLAFASYHDLSYDAWSHMFFASHYMRSWFDTWEPRWFGGFSVTSYPPLAHQVLALLSWGFGLERAYAALDLLLMATLPLAVFRFAAIFVSSDRAGNAALLSVVLPALWRLNYAYGQFTTVFSLWLTLAGVAFLGLYLTQGQKRHLVGAAALLVSAVAAHPHTGGFLMPPLALVVAIWTLMHSAERSVVARRVALSGLVVFVGSVLVVFPFWQFMLSGGTSQEPTLHASRGNLFRSSTAFREFFLYLYLYFLLLLPFTFVPAIENRKLIPLLVLGLLLFVLGLGGTTPLPRLLFGNFWLWLTYERFSFWASVVVLPIWGTLLGDVIVLLASRWRVVLVAGAAVVFILSGGYMFSQRFFQATQPPPVDLTPLKDFLNSDAARRWRYVTLDMGWGQLGELSTMVEAPTLDGIYFTGRRLPELRRSGVGTINDARYYAGGLPLLADILGNASRYNLKVVLSRGAFYDDMLGRAGFHVVLDMQKAGDVRYGDVRIWVKDNVPPLGTPYTPRASPQGVWWGTAPLVAFGVAVVAVALKPRELLVSSTL